MPSIETFWEKNDWDGINEEPLITEHPLKLYERGAHNKVPYITGFNANEAMLFIRSIKNKSLNNMNITNLKSMYCFIILKTNYFYIRITKNSKFTRDC